MRILGLTGRAGVGKSTVAQRLGEELNIPVHEFGAAIYRTLSNLGIYAYIRKEWDSTRPVYNGKTHRVLRQGVGEGLRGIIGPDIWIHALKKELQLDRAIISDVRHRNEAEWIISEGGRIVEIYDSRMGYELENPDHISEQGISGDKVHSTIDKTYLDKQEVTEGLIQEWQKLQ